MRRALILAVMGALVFGTGASSWAAEAAEPDEKKIIHGPSKTVFGALELVLAQGASTEVAYQPDASRLALRTLVGEARVITAARYLILVETTEGRVEILLPNGRVIQVEPGKSEIVGRALVDDPGSITIRLSGIGPLAQAGGPPVGVPQTVATVTVMTGGPSAAILPILNPFIGHFYGDAINPLVTPRPELSCSQPTCVPR